MGIKSGLYNISNDEYHNGPKWQDMLSSGLVRALAKGERYGWQYKYGDRVVSEAMLIGSAWHDRVLQPDVYNSDYVVAPKVDRRTKVGKAEWAAFLADAGSKQVLTADHSYLIERMTDAVWDSKSARALLNDGAPEESIVWAGDGILKKARPDYRNGRMKLLVDLKSCQSADLESCKRDIIKRQYHWQAWWYLQGVQQVIDPAYENFVFIFVEKSEPYTVQPILLNHDWLEIAGEAIRDSRIEDRYRGMMNSDDKPGQPELQELLPPAWMYKLVAQ